MSLITEFTVPAEAFALEYTFETVSEVKIEIERLATHSREWVMPLLWATGENLEPFETAIREDPTIKEVQTVDAPPGIGLYNIHWSEDVQELIDTIVDQHGIMQQAHAADGTWYLKLRFLNQDLLEDFQSYFHEHDYAFELQRLYDGSTPKEREYDLTASQREVLLLALERGYFSIPREAQITDLADELDISANAVSERLRRATASLTRNTLRVTSPHEQFTTN